MLTHFPGVFLSTSGFWPNTSAEQTLSESVMRIPGNPHRQKTTHHSCEAMFKTELGLELQVPRPRSSMGRKRLFMADLNHLEAAGVSL